VVVGMAVGERDVHTGLPWEEDGGAGMLVEGGGGTNNVMQGGGRGRKIEGELEGWDGNGEPNAWCCWGGTCLWRGAAVIAIVIVAAVIAIAIAAVKAMGRSCGTNEKLADCQSAAERDKRDQDNAKRRGEGDPPQETREFGWQGHVGAMMPAFKSF
jgi:hypothetical protein